MEEIRRVKSELMRGLSSTLMIKDDMIFEPYMPEYRENAWRCVMEVSTGKISVRFGGRGLFTDNNRPYEVWYPEDDTPTGYQTADDIWDYINSLNKQKYT